MIEIQAAQEHQALSIARLIMLAMNYDCCRYFTGPEHTLDDFERVMTELVLADNTQYSYRNTIVAIDEDGKLCGMCVSYDGARLHELRAEFIKAAKDNFGRELSNMEDETGPGELYIDSIAAARAWQPRCSMPSSTKPKRWTYQPSDCLLTKETQRPKSCTAV